MIFWQDWPLWLKLIFVLSIAIGLTIIAGTIKLGYDQWKIKKFTKIEKEKMEEQPMVEEFARQRRGRQADPFGVRAIESGIEVEGVWISRNNSPSSSAAPSPMLGPQGKGKSVSRLSEIPSLQIPEQSHPHVDRGHSPTGSMGSFERATSAERVESVSGSSDHAPVPSYAYKPRQPSALRFSTADDMEAGHLPLRSGSGSSQGSSEGSGTAFQQHHPTGYQQVREPTYYRPSGMEHYTSGPSSPQSARLSPEYGNNGRSSRSSQAAQGYTYGVPDPHKPPNPQRFHYSSDPQISSTGPYTPSQAPSERGSMLAAIELTDNPTMGNIQPDKAKRVTRKLQKKSQG